MSVNHKLQYSLSSDSASLSLSGYDNESGNSEIVIGPENFAASSVNSPLTLALTAANLQDVFLVSDKGCTITTNGTGTPDSQTVSISGTPTGGTFALGYGGQITAPIAYNAAASAVQSALQALSAIGSGNLTCSGGPLPGTPVACTFAGTLATGLKSLMAQNSGGLTGGSSPAVSVAHTTPGLPQDTIVLSPGIPLVWGRSTGNGANPFAGNVTSAFVSCTPSCRLQGRILTS